MKPKVIILRGPGTNCDQETAHAFSAEGAHADVVHINALKKKPSLLRTYSLLCIPGGFTYGDDISAGKILANELLIFLRDALEEFIGQGRPILGICNGFQVLVKTGILPAMDFSPRATLARNDSLKFEARWVHLKVVKETLWTNGLSGKVITLPVAHGEGRFAAEKNVVDHLESAGQVLFRYVDPQGSSGAYPVNPNGSVNDIAGIIDPTGLVMGLMPHPERFYYPNHHPYGTLLTAGDLPVTPWGRRIFQNAMEYVRKHISKR